MPQLSPSTSRQETRYIEIITKHPAQVLLAKDDAPLEGFAYFASKEYRKKLGKRGNLFTDKFRSMSPRNFPKFFKIMASNVIGIMGARRRSFTDISTYTESLKKNGQNKVSKSKYLQSYPNEALWQALSEYAWEKWRVSFGFTEVPQEIIFRGKAILFKYALVAIQEMDRQKIDTAPGLSAGEEVLSVYNSLGVAVNDIARWLRKNHAIRCQANHPLGGLVNTVPLAVKAGLGWSGSNGLLITPEYGQRQRIAPIFIEEPIFQYTDSNEHQWIEKYCALCGRCRKACPTGAILEKKVLGSEKIGNIGYQRTCIVREKCYPYFNETLGCSICVRVCPFSRADGTYERLKKVVEKQSSQH